MSLRAALHSAALLALLFPLAPTATLAQISLSVQIAPPPLPIYVQPEVPGEGYLWTPGYWGWGDDINEYYWVPGTWVLAPQPGYLWTPGYWGFYSGGYRWNMGYWGSSVGFYGGVNYGFGYGGRGFEGGRWDRGVFRYNRSVTNVNVNIIRNVYIKKVVVRPNTTHISFNGGPKGVRAQATVAEQRVAKSNHIERTAVPVQHEQAARRLSSGPPPITGSRRWPPHPSLPTSRRRVRCLRALRSLAVPTRLPVQISPRALIARPEPSNPPGWTERPAPISRPAWSAPRAPSRRSAQSPP
jgi:hypothetical protein